MLSILLTILKVIGIILLVILGAAVLLVVLVLFVPMRYRGHIVREDRPLRADGKISWFKKLLTIDFLFEGKKGTVTVSLFGKTKKVFHIPGESDSAEQRSAGHEDIPDASLKKEDEAVKDPVRADASYMPGLPSEERPGGAQPEAPKKQAKAARRRKTLPDPFKKLRGQGDRLARKAEDLAQAFFALPGVVISALTDAGQSAADKMDQAEMKIRKAKRKADPFLTADSFALYRKILAYLASFIKHCRFRRFTGYVKVGTGEPDLTGNLTGLIFMVLPGAAKDYRVEADFYDKVFRTDTEFQGNIRLCHAAVMAIGLFRDKQFRCLMALIRHRKKKVKSEVS